MKQSPNLATSRSVARLLLDAAELSGRDDEIHFLTGRSGVQTLSYGDLLDLAQRALFQLTQQGVGPGSRVIVQAGDSKTQLALLWGCLLGGITPALMPRVSHRAGGTKEGDRLKGAITALGQPYFIAPKGDIAALEESDALGLIAGARPVGIDADFAEAGPVHIRFASPEDCAYIQFSSGSTRMPKGVQLSHANLLNNVESMIYSGGFTQTNGTCVSWMPYSHDMGLIGFHLLPLALRAPQVKLESLDFLRDPMHWLRALDRFGAGNTGSPNFGLEHVLDRLTEEDVRSLDLSGLRVFQTGAEPIRHGTLTRFSDLMAHAGLARTAICPVYGLAEVCVGAVTPDTSLPPRLVRFDRKALRRHGKAEPVDERDATRPATTFVAVGQPIRDMALSVRDAANAECAEGVIGEICLRGPSVMIAYLNAEQAVDANGWLHTGDMGVLHEGDLFVTGRRKNVLIVNGCNLVTSDVEEHLGEMLGLSAGSVAVGSVLDASGAEQVLIFVQKRRLAALAEGDIARAARIVARAAASYIEAPIHRVVPVAAIPRTTSGKIQNFALSEQFALGAYDDVAIEPSASRAPETGPATDPADLRLCVRRLWSRVLELDDRDFDDHVAFAALGGSSVKAFRFISLLEDELARPLATELLLDCRTVAEIVAALGEPGSDRPMPDCAAARPSGMSGTDRVAVIGMAGRFPDAQNLDQYLQNLGEGRVSTRQAPFSLADGSPCHWAPLDDKALFAAAEFGISENEATITDPAQRIMLELALEAVEDAGLGGSALERNAKAGIYIGAGSSGNAEFLAQADLPQAQRSMPEMLVANLPNIIAARIAKHFGFRGPALSVDTACSSSLVALHYACRDLAAGLCDYALVGGINLINGPAQHRLLAQAGALSRSGRSMPFAVDADGIVPGEGAGMVVLRRLSDAEAHHDRIDAVVLSTTVNNDGRSLSLMAPSAEGQEGLLARNIMDAGCAAADIGLIEAHSTGTLIGDPVELRSISRGLSSLGAGTGCRVGSVKANIGHLLAAAGIASFIKTVLSLRTARFLPHPAPRGGLIDFTGTGLIPSAGSDWDQADGKPLALVNSFGFGGTNAQAILAPGPAAVATADSGLRCPVILSAPTEALLKDAAQVLLHWLIRNRGVPLTRVARSMWLRNRNGAVRSAARVSTLDALLDWLAAPTGGHLSEDDPLAAWCAGEDVDLSGLCDGLPASAPLPLPPTPRARQRFELPGQFPRAALPAPLFAADMRFGSDLGRDIEHWVYETAWEPIVPSTRGVDRTDAPIAVIAWDGQDVDASLAGLKANAHCLRVPRNGAATVDTLHGLLACAQWEQVIDVRALSGDADDFGKPFPTGAAALDAVTDVLLLANVVRRLPSAPRLVVVTALDRGHIASDMIWALTRSLELEIGSGSVTSLQLESTDAAAEAVSRVVHVNLHGSLRWTSTGPYRERLAQSVLGAAKPLALKGKSAIIIGGAGGVGRRLAETLAHRGAARLYLTGRRAADELPQDVLAAFEKIRAIGTSVEYVCLDLADERGMAAFADRLAADLITPRLAVHSATDEIFVDTTSADRAAVERQCAAKITGSLNLVHHIGPGLDGPMVLFGSLTGLTGGKEQALYAAANRGQAAIVERARNRGIDMRLINWGVWARTGRARDVPDVLLNAISGSRALEPDAALELFSNLLDHEAAPAVHVANISHARARSLGVESAVAHGEASSSRVAREAQRPDRSGLHHLLHEYCALRLLDELRARISCFGSATTREALRQQMQVTSDRRLHFERILDILCEAGFLRTSGPDGIALDQFPEDDRLAVLGAEIRRHGSDSARLVDFVERCVAALPEVLNGQVDATAVLCPGGDTEELALLYRLDDGLQIAQSMVAQVLAENSSDDFDILEIGAGTGALTDTVLPSLKDARGHYVFTDIGQGFLNRARKHYDAEPLFAVARFDLELPPDRQGLGDIQVDAVIGTNVLHAVSELAPAVNRLRGMLKPGGWLMLVETFAPNRVADCTVGMFDGWWAFRDHALRPGYPLMGVRNWQAVLSRAGFDVACVPAKSFPGPGEIETGLVLARLPATQSELDATEPADVRTNRFASLLTRTVPVARSQPRPDDRTIAADQVAESVMQVLRSALGQNGLNDVDADADFFEIGLDSISALEVVGVLEKQIGVSLSPGAFFEFSNLRALAAHIAGLNPRLHYVEPADPDVAAETAADPIPASRLVAEQVVDYALSDSATRMWIADSLQSDAATYTIENSLSFEGRLDPGALEQALRAVIAEQDALRSRLVTFHGQPRIKITDDVVLPFRLVDLSTLGAAERDAALEALRIETKQSAFDLSEEPPLRVTLVRISEYEHVLVTVMHHLMSDGWSLTVLVRRAAQLYNALIQGQPLPVAPTGALRLRDVLAGNGPTSDGGEDLDLVMAQIGADVEPVSLPWDRAPNGLPSGKGHLAMSSLGPDDTKRLRKAAGKAGVTLFQMVSGLYGTWLGRLSGQSEVSFVTPSAGRDDPAVQNMVGFFVNMLPIRMSVRSDLDLSETALAARQSCDLAFSRRGVGFERIVGALAKDRDPLASQPFNTALVVQGRQWSTGMKLSFAGLTTEVLPEVAPSALYDLTLFLRETEDDVRIELNGSCDVFERQNIDIFLGYFVEMLRNALRAPEQPVYGASMVDAATRQVQETADARMLSGALAMTRSSRVEAEFASVARRHADRPCLSDGNRHMTYREVDATVNRLARAILDRVGHTDGRVALWMPRGLDTVIAMLAVARAGLAYLPLSIDDGPERLRQILNVARPVLTIVNQPDPSHWVSGEMPLLDVSADADAIAAFDDTDLPRQTKGADAPLYVLFTSGSTGEPKGVEIRHDSVVSLVRNSEALFGFSAEDVWSCLHAFTFDFTTWEIWGPLLTGGCMVLASDDVRRDPRALADFVSGHSVTVMNSTPNMFYAFDLAMAESPQLEELHTIRLVIFGGDRLSPARLTEWVRRNPMDRTVLWNCFGITETTVHVTGHKLTPQDVAGDASVIGGPLPGYAVLLRDRLGLPSAPGLPGEIWVGGTGVANCYIGQAALTAERFRSLPGAATGDAILFRSGDLARQRLDGQVDYLGRADRQLKFLSYRIEAGEIETALLKHPDITEAFVLVGRDSSGQTQLSAFVVTTPETPVHIAALREFLQPHLPPYMCPTRLIRLESLPLNRNGKVDRAALLQELATATNAATEAHAEAETETETAIVDLYEEILGRGSIGRHTGFFDAGGNSILGGQLHNRLCKHFGINLELRDVFFNSTPAALAGVIDELIGSMPEENPEWETGEI